MARRQDSEITKERILSACIKFFIEKGYHGTTIAEILNEADATNSSFQKIFKNKEGVLLELVKHMFGSQFEFAKFFFGGNEVSPALYYVAETAIQLTITELNENLRDIYVEAYNNRDALEFICQNTAKELQKLFGANLPSFGCEDFYEIDIATSGIMRAYMQKKCDETFSLEEKIEKFTAATLRIFGVPQSDIDEATEFVKNTDFRSTANAIMQNLFKKYRMKYNFNLSV